MADYNRNKGRHSSKSASPAKEWNIPTTMTTTTTATSSPSEPELKGSKSHAATSTTVTSDYPSTKSSTYESLFDSGYNSSTLSTSSIYQSQCSVDLESEFQEKLNLSKNLDNERGGKIVSLTRIPSWQDSGVSVTDSGLGIDSAYSESDYARDKLRFLEEEEETATSAAQLSDQTAITLADAYQQDQDGDT